MSLSASTNFITSYIFPRADLNNDGELTRSELAGAALIANEGSAERAALATMVLGGVDGTGLFPDFDENGLISKNELLELGSSTQTLDIDPSDFEARFPDQFVEGGSSFTTEDLEALAADDFINPNPVQPTPEEVQFQAFVTAFVSLVLNFFFNLLGIGGGHHGATGSQFFQGGGNQFPSQ
ncbi:MAG: hypothetical protein AAGI66_07845 [Cyanobacteria bacterium P01_H01_bin.74]